MQLYRFPGFRRYPDILKWMGILKTRIIVGMFDASLVWDRRIRIMALPGTAIRGKGIFIGMDRLSARGESWCSRLASNVTLMRIAVPVVP